MSSSTDGMSYEDAVAYKRQQMRKDPRMYVSYNWNHPNDPTRKYDFKTNDGDPLGYLVDDEGPLNPQEWGSINVLMMARGCLKTTSVQMITQWACDMIPQSESFMTAPSQKQVREFMDKFTNSIKGTPLEKKRVRDRMSHQKFETNIKNDDGDVNVATANVKAWSAWNADDGMRGPHAHIGIIDEMQDVDESAFSVFLEIIDKKIPDDPTFPCVFIIGTPKLKQSFFHRMWELSNQRTWDQEDQSWVDHSDVGDYSPAGFEGDGFTIKGWKVDQINSPLHDRSTIEFKRSEYSEKKFENEVLANFYSPEDDLLSEQHIQSAFDPTSGFRNSRQHSQQHSDVVITTDWGGGSGQDAADTVFSAAEVTQIGDGPRDYECRLLRTRFLPHEMTGREEEDLLCEWIGRYNPDHVLVDEGHNGTRRESLQESYPGLVHGVYYGNPRPAEDVRWHRDDAERKVFATVNKSYVVESFVDSFKDGKFKIPSDDLSFDTKRSDGNKIIDQLTAPYKDYDDTASGSKNLKVLTDDSRNDDIFDTFVYLWCGIEHVHKGAELTDVWVGDMPGY